MLLTSVLSVKLSKMQGGPHWACTCGKGVVPSIMFYYYKKIVWVWNFFTKKIISTAAHNTKTCNKNIFFILKLNFAFSVCFGCKVWMKQWTIFRFQFYLVAFRFSFHFTTLFCECVYCEADHPVYTLSFTLTYTCIFACVLYVVCC